MKEMKISRFMSIIVLLSITIVISCVFLMTTLLKRSDADVSLEMYKSNWGISLPNESVLEFTTKSKGGLGNAGEIKIYSVFQLPSSYPGESLSKFLTGFGKEISSYTWDEYQRITNSFSSTSESMLFGLLLDQTLTHSNLNIPYTYRIEWMYKTNFSWGLCGSSINNQEVELYIMFFPTSQRLVVLEHFISKR